MTVTQKIQTKLNDSPVARWGAMLIVSFTMMCGYFITDVMAPLEEILTQTTAEGGLGWTSDQYGFFSGAYGFINVFLLMLFFGGIILDKCGIRFTGTVSCALMLIGTIIKWYAIDNNFGDAETFGYPMQVAVAALGFAIFGLGAEITGITVTKVIAKWFTGHELALAMGLQVAMARIGTAAALACSLPIANAVGRPSAPILLGAALLCVGFVSYLVYCVMDRKLDTSLASNADSEPEEGFHFADLKVIFNNTGFWLIAILCVLFYSGVFPFLKFATKLMIHKYEVDPELAGLIPAMLPFGTILLTPIFGRLYDRVGKGATLMIIGSAMLTIVHILFALPLLNVWWFAIIIMIILGVAFSLVPSAMWPSVPKIIPMKQLGSAYAIIFYIQNIGLSMVPIFIGNVIQDYSTITAADGTVTYDYTIPMCIFTLFGFVAITIALLLKKADAKYGYGLEKKNME
ncbi:MAG: MFS transporter [Bacteroidaceae bacterium]|nr:MFS transporter [Bacteroidaceae bacterium]